ncbi:hypothetical protein [Anaerotignum propionicum]|uniref:Rubrerythrin n=1 Tax=Anaerotignum propionicum DSM 1682 TaxID=991789 RepID=A0A0X8VE09_ANAPI|nr:hypothetical protein [Anaerotignum propionicum]AMJ42264.1 hypothetical protein CPRO_27160 [Anaerotignum propionicum DSM 1682]MEA5056818.1 hypothetical protein [Anaerotignum propionicum]SHE55114.1 hypothetical protein SAMN02745151_01081 [[Clostridium] propionicum DSM 1682] [Anaerotignum propionicum DSM 1682]
MYPYNRNTRNNNHSLEIKERGTGSPGTSGTPTMQGTPTMNGTPTMGGTPTMQGTPTMNGTPTMQGTPTMRGTPTMGGTPTMQGTPTMRGTPTMGGTPTMQGTPTMRGTPTMGGTPTMQGTPTMRGTPTMSGTPTMRGTPTISGNNGTNGINGVLTENQKAALAEDHHLMEILYMAQQDSADMAERYANLMTDPNMASSANVLKTMYLDELKHINQLKEAYYLITGTRDTNEITGTTPDTLGQELLEDTLLLEIDNGDFYRSLFLSMPSQDLRDIFFEISADKMSHGNALSYLFAKYYAG